MEAMAMLEKAEGDNAWLQEHFEEIQKEHPNEFVAMSEGEVIAEGRSSVDVVNEVKRKGENPAVVLIEFIPEKGLILIL
ncbi:MAG: DUF5678 domain-containing protein [Planctomycetota bacterium]|jgi:hypothetical protein